MHRKLNLGTAPYHYGRAKAKFFDKPPEDSHFKQVLGGPNGKDTYVYRRELQPILLAYLRLPDDRLRTLLNQDIKIWKKAPKRSEKRSGAYSGSVGFVAPDGIYPFGRTAGFTKKHPKEWSKVLPVFEILNDVYAEAMPDDWAQQNAVALYTSDDFLIPKPNGDRTVFTTGTVNARHQFKYHIDKENLACGMSVMTVWRKEPHNFRGGFVVFPRWEISIDMQCGDVLIFDGLELHGNSPFYGNGERISIVAYYQRKMQDCGSFEDEEEKAKRLVRADWQK